MGFKAFYSLKLNQGMSNSFTNIGIKFIKCLQRQFREIEQHNYQNWTL